MGWIISIALVAGLFVLPALAHHAARFNHDTTKVVTIKGTVERVAWNNPHVWIWLSVKRDNGQVETQRVQIAAPGRLTKNGLSKDSLSYGDLVSIDAWPPTNGQSLPEGRTLTLADGRSFDVGDNWSER